MKPVIIYSFSSHSCMIHVSLAECPNYCFTYNTKKRKSVVCLKTEKRLFWSGFAITSPLVYTHKYFFFFYENHDFIHHSVISKILNCVFYGSPFPTLNTKNKKVIVSFCFTILTFFPRNCVYISQFRFFLTILTCFLRDINSQFSNSEGRK